MALAALEASPRAAVSDTELGLSVPGAVDLGASPSGMLTILVTFPVTNPTGLLSFLADLSNPGSPEYHHYLTAGQFDSQFGGDDGSYSQALAFLRSYPVRNVSTTADHLSISFQATAATVGAIFDTQIETFASAAGEYYAPTTPISLPLPLAASIAAIEGLSSYSGLTLRGLSADATVIAPPPAVPPPSFSAPPGYLPPAVHDGVQYEFAPDLQLTYDEPSLFNQTGFPTDMVIATILWSGTNRSGAAVAPWIPSDIYDFYNQTLPSWEPHPHVYGVPLFGALEPGPSAGEDNTSAHLENTLDLEMAGSTAPGATIYNVYGRNATDAQLDAAFAYILNPSGTPGLASVSVITNSWGSADSQDASWNESTQEATARGITVVASSGDSASDPASPEWVGSAVEFPSSLAFNSYGVTAVGGTSVTLSPTTLRVSAQSAWFIPQGGPVGTSGGISSVYAEPSWQLDTEANTILKGAGRGAPDIAAVANNTLLTITIGSIRYNATSILSGGAFEYAWGTSIASPLVAGLVAEIDHALAFESDPAVGFLNPLLYQLAQAQYAPLEPSQGGEIGFLPTGGYNSSLPALPFLDVIHGANAKYPARFAYDLATGWGSIDAYNYTMYLLTVNSTGIPGRLSGVQDLLNLTNLNVTTPPPGSFNASIQQNFFLADALGAPIYWIQNVIYVNQTPGGWSMTFSGWVAFPFYGLYYSSTIYEYNFPAAVSVSLPVTFDISTTLSPGSGLAGPHMTFSFGDGQPALELPVPGAAFIIGSQPYSYDWQGAIYTNGPFPGNPYPGGLSPQFGLVGGPSGGAGSFTPPTAATIVPTIEPFGTTNWLVPSSAAFDTSVDQTGETAYGLNWIRSAHANTWQTSTSSCGAHNSCDQGVLYHQGYAGNAVEFNSSGLPPGTVWGGALDGRGWSVSGPGYSTQLLNGSYTYAIRPPSGYRVDPSSGSVNVSGSPTIVDLNFSSAADTFAATFTESGLPSGEIWYLNVTGQSPAASVFPTIALSLPNGTYSYSIAAADKRFFDASPQGTFTVSGAPLGRTVLFQPFYYDLVFRENGLPEGTSWNIALASTLYTSTGASLSIPLTNGTFAFTVGSVNGYSSQPGNGSVTVSGPTSPIRVAFTQVTYTVAFTETGLPHGTWGATFNGTTLREATGSPILFTNSVANGTWGYNVSGFAGYTTAWSGTVRIAGSAQTVPVAFTQVLYTVTFAETGLTNGTWGVTFNGTTLHAATGSSILFANSVANGTWGYNVSGFTGYTPSPSSGTVRVAGADQAITIAYTSAGGGPFSILGIPAGVLVVAVVVPVAVVFSLVAIALRRRRGP